jgi:DUF1009 family protein
MSEPAAEVLGLIAGEGTFPLDVARAARRGGRRVSAVAFRGRTDPRIADEVVDLTWIHPGEVAAGLAALRGAGVRELVMVGKVPKADLLRDPQELRLDSQASQLIDELEDRRDDTILLRVPQWALLPDALAGEGPLGSRAPTPAQEVDIAFGFPIAKKLGELDVGQTVVVKDRAVLALEAIEGTDLAIRRAGTLAPGGVVVKVAKPGQDPRFDVPTIGLRTVQVLAEARCAVLAFEAGATVVLERDALVREADERGIAVCGVDPKRFETGGG